jgi:hypothetical protein
LRKKPDWDAGSRWVTVGARDYEEIHARLHGLRVEKCVTVRGGGRMKDQSPRVILLGLFLVGCASAGPAADEEPTVPVYGPNEKTPCEYEAIGPVRAEAWVGLQNARGYEEARAQELGRVGARIGADAVILPDTRVQLPFSVPGAPTRTLLRFEGQAVTWIEGTCKRRTPKDGLDSRLGESGVRRVL